MKISFILCSIIPFIMVIGCDNQPHSSIDSRQSKSTQDYMEKADVRVGMPQITNFRERRLTKMILEMRDDQNLICYAYLSNVQEGKVGEYLGRCMGYPIPYSVEFTNPDRVMDVNKELGIYKGNQGEIQIVHQPEPNGLFMSKEFGSTWVMLLDDSNNQYPVYFESDIIVSPFPLHELKKENDGTAN